MAIDTAALPEPFIGRMRELLGAELEAFLAALAQPRTRALRLNPAKTTAAELRAQLGIALHHIPWCPQGFTFPDERPLGGHPAHLAGLFYLQEPSAMAVAAAADPATGATVVDLAAAPGGKTTHLSSLVGDTGLVVANDTTASRLRPLHDNLDLWGGRNLVTTSMPVASLPAHGALFDVAVLDAPCSGEGLFRRDPGAVRHWSTQAVDGAARRQRGLLREAAGLVRSGGVLIYSTCTFAIEENEQQLADFLSEHPGWELAELARWPGVQPGYQLPPAPTHRTARLWPHHLAGEGQFIARLRRTGTPVPATAAGRRPAGRRPSHRPGAAVSAAQVRRAWQEFHEQVVPGFPAPAERLLVRQDRLFLLPDRRPPLPEEVLARPGLPLGRLRPGRFEPHPALATAVRSHEPARRVMFAPESPELAAYLSGQTSSDPGPDGWVLVCYDRWGLGWARRSQGVLKNKLPTHLRQMAGRWAAGQRPS